MPDIRALIHSISVKALKAMFILCLGILPIGHVYATTLPYSFELQGINGVVKDSDVAGKYILLSFGYTSSPDISPTTQSQASVQINKVDDTSVPDQQASASSTSTKAKDSTAIGASLPKGFTQYDGELMALSKIIKNAPNGPVLLNLWASWCAPCRQELPLLDKTAGTTSAVKIITLNLVDRPEVIAKQFTDLNLKYLSMDTTDNFGLLGQLGGMGLPFSVLYVNDQPVAAKNGLIRETQSIIQWAQAQ